MKKLIYKFAALFIAFLLIFCSVGCDAERNGDIYDANEKQKNDGTLYILCAGFSEYDWTRNILGDNPSNIRLELLNMSGTDMHSYQPSVSDMVKLADCDLLIYTGGISEFWIDEASESSEKGNKEFLSLMEYFEENPQLFPEYTQDEHEHEHSHEHESDEHSEHTGEFAEDEHSVHTGEAAEDEHGGHEHEHEADEHIWLSLKTAQIFCEKIASTLSELDSENSGIYEANLKEYTGELAALDESFAATVSAAANDVLIFADRFPFTYMMQDYGIHSHAAFSGCSAETEASFETVIELAEELNNDGLKRILILKSSTSGEKLANTVIAAAERKNVEIRTLDSLQSVTASDIAEGYTYIETMKGNMEVISECLN